MHIPVILGHTSGELDLLTKIVAPTMRYMPLRCLLDFPEDEIYKLFIGKRNLIIYRLSDLVRLPVPIEMRISRHGIVYATVTPI